MERFDITADKQRAEEQRRENGRSKPDMKIHFLTSRFDMGFSDEFITALKPHLPPKPSFAFVASNFSGHEKSEKYLNVFIELFEEKGIFFSKTQIVDFSISRAEARSVIEAADVVWLSGGDTLLQISQIREYSLIEPLQARNGVTIGMSAGSINMARKVVLAKDKSDNIPELSVYDGIGLTDFNIEPHVNAASPEHIAEILEASKLAPIYGLYDGSFILEAEGKIQIFGKYDAYFNGECRRGLVPSHGQVTAACGNDCSQCPRYLPKTEVQLAETAKLWADIGYRDQVVSPTEIACAGCFPENWCRYKIVGCTEEKGAPTCGSCPEYPCSKIEECFHATGKFIPQCKAVATKEQYASLEKAFFQKRENLDKIKAKS